MEDQTSPEQLRESFRGIAADKVRYHMHRRYSQILRPLTRCKILRRIMTVKILFVWDKEIVTVIICNTILH